MFLSNPGAPWNAVVTGDTWSMSGVAPPGSLGCGLRNCVSNAYGFPSGPTAYPTLVSGSFHVPRVFPNALPSPTTA